MKKKNSFFVSVLALSLIFALSTATFGATVNTGNVEANTYDAVCFH